MAPAPWREEEQSWSECSVRGALDSRGYPGQACAFFGNPHAGPDADDRNDENIQNGSTGPGAADRAGMNRRTQTIWVSGISPLQSNLQDVCLLLHPSDAWTSRGHGPSPGACRHAHRAHRSARQLLSFVVNSSRMHLLLSYQRRYQ